MKERWDIEVRFLNGPLANHQIYTYQGPQVNIGSDPGVGGMQLRRPMISPVHARIDCFAKGQVTIHPIEYAEVRVATHVHENWEKIDPLYKPVPLMDGNVVYIGPLGHGIVFIFERAKTFDWQTEQLSSLVDQSNQIDISLSQNTKAKTIRVSKYPVWFFPGLIGMVSVTAIILFTQLLGIFTPPPPTIGPQWEGYNPYMVIDIDEKVVDLSLLEGFNGPFEDFVMGPNQQQSGIKHLGNTPDMWDKRLRKAVFNSLKQYSKWRGFWKRLDEIRDDYAYVVDALRDADLPEVFAGIPFQETQYRKNLVSAVCAAGIWQFMPETANRYELRVKKCKLKKGKGISVWEPKPNDKAPPLFVRKADYILYNQQTRTKSCLIKSCAADDRTDRDESTRAAIKMLRETYTDETLAESGSLVQSTILAHNAGYHDKQYLKRIKPTNILPAYTYYRDKSKKKHGIHFYGDNLCPAKTKGKDGEEPQKKCPSFLHEETQHYGYKVIAYHILAVCYYAKNYPDEPAFKEWKRYLGEDGYCKNVHAPEREEQ